MPNDNNQLSPPLILVPVDDDAPPDEASVRELEAEVARRRERLSSTLRTLRSEIHDASHWRHWYERHPYVFVAGAALAGYAAGQIFFSRR